MGFFLHNQQMALPSRFSISRLQSPFSPSSVSIPLISQQTLKAPSPPASRFCTAQSAFSSSDSSSSLRCFCQSSNSSPRFDEFLLNRIFIKGISKSTSEGSLKSAFSQYGEVAHVKIIIDNKTRESLGFAYIVFSNEEDAQLAIKEMNGKFFEGRFIYVTNAKPGTIKQRAKVNQYKF